METLYKNPTYTLFLATFTLGHLTGCGLRTVDSQIGSESTLMVDLDAEGNAKLKKDAERFRLQLTTETKFLENEKLPRVLLQGFGAFQDVPREQNASYQVVNGSMQRFTHGEVKKLMVDGVEMQTSVGVINGRKVRIFSMINDVNPVTAAYLAHSRNIIQPSFTLSSGQASTSRVERYSSNSITNEIPSFNSEGEVDPLLSNIGTRVDESRPEGEKQPSVYPPPYSPKPAPIDFEIPGFSGNQFSNFLPTELPQNTIVSNSSNPVALASKMGLPVGGENTTGGYMCNLAKITNDYQDQKMDLQLTKDYKIPSMAPSGSVFVHWGDTRQLQPKEQTKEIDTRVTQVEVAVSTGLGIESPLPPYAPISIPSAPEMSDVQETPSGFPTIPSSGN